MDEQKFPLDRRSFLTWLATCSAAAILPRGLPERLLAQQTGGTTTANEVAEIFLDLYRVHKWDNSNGDTWDPFWADDDALYAFNCDGRGFGVKGMNLAFNRLSGSTPETLAGTQINEMDEYGRSGQKGPDNATWKACGQECIDGVFYAFVSRNIYGSDSWGPWNPISSISDRFLGPNYHMYGPSLCARFQQRLGADIEISLFTAGCPFDDVPNTPYKIWHIPLLLRTMPLPESVLVAAADKQIRYRGAWFPWTTVEGTAEDQLPRATQTKGAAAQLTFAGTGVEYIAQKSIGLGTVDISLDHAQQESVSLDLEDFPVFFGVTVFSKQNLPKKQHVIRIQNAGESRVNLEGFRVYS